MLFNERAKRESYHKGGTVLVHSLTNPSFGQLLGNRALIDNLAAYLVEANDKYLSLCAEFSAGFNPPSRTAR